LIKVLNIRSSFNAGGTETLLLNLFNFKQNHIKIYLALIKGGDYTAKLNNSENIFYELKRKYFFDIKIIRKLNTIIKQNKIKIIHTHQEIELLYAVALKLLNPSIKIFHSIHLFNPNYNLDHYLEFFLIKFVKKIIVVSDSLKKKLVRQGYTERKLVRLYNAVALQSSFDVIKLEQFKSKINFNAKDFIIMMIGNFRPEKDHITLLKAFNLLREEFTNIKLVFLGRENELTKSCKEITRSEDLNKRVFYLGAVEDAWVYLQFCDLFVFSSLSETFGIVVIEALLMKKPVFASDIDVMKELSENEKYFNLFKKGDEVDLSKKIKSFLSPVNKEEQFNLLDKAELYAKQTFSYNNYFNDLVKIYSE